MQISGIEWGEDDDDDFELEENKDMKMSEKGGKENIGTTTELSFSIIVLKMIKLQYTFVLDYYNLIIHIYSVPLQENSN